MAMNLPKRSGGEVELPEMISFYALYAMVAVFSVIGARVLIYRLAPRADAKGGRPRKSVNPNCLLGNLTKIGADAVRFDGVLIVGAGPAGLAAAACLRECGVPSIVLERAECIGSLWQHKTYDRLHLHLPKCYCELPMLPFPRSFPTYPSRQQFIDYLINYAAHFEIHPRYGQQVVSSIYDAEYKLWRVLSTKVSKSFLAETTEYSAQRLVVASGENAEAFVPNLPGIQTYQGIVLHSSQYRNGKDFRGKRALVVGSGNSGMEIALDLANHEARTSLIIRSQVHVLPRDIFRIPIYTIIMWTVKTFPLWLADIILVSSARMRFGDVSKYGIRAPEIGPLQRKKSLGKTPVLDVGTISCIQHGKIQVLPSVESFTSRGAKLVDGTHHLFDAVVMATGFTSNAHCWLKGEEGLFSKNGFPSCGWNAERGLYFVGFSRNGIYGASEDARKTSDHIRTEVSKQNKMRLT